MGDLNFLEQEPPPGYVAGLGRGATGFVTSAESGPAVFLSNFGFEVHRNGAENTTEGVSLVRNSAENEEADKIYQQIDVRVQSRRKKRSKSLETEFSENVLENNVNEKLKSELSQVSVLEWMNLPEVGDLTRKNKRQRLLEQQLQRVYATPDVLIAGSMTKNFQPAINDEEFANKGEQTNYKENSDEREIPTDFAMDPEKERQILSSLRRAEPKNPNLWISSALYEEQANQYWRAKKYIKEGCLQIPDNEKVWLESIRLHKSEGVQVCKSIVHEALSYNSKSEKLWIVAMNLERNLDSFSKKKLMHKALESLPRSVKLWDMLIDLVVNFEETEKEEKLRILENASRMCPDEWRFWELLVSLSDYTTSKQTLNTARKLSPRNPKVWIAALKVEEKEYKVVSPERLTKILQKGVSELRKNGVLFDSIDWPNLASNANSEYYPKTAEAIISEMILRWKEALKYQEVFEKVESLNEYGKVIATIAYKTLTREYPKELSGWVKYLDLSRECQPNKLSSIYEEALLINQVEVLYLKYGRNKFEFEEKPEEAKMILEKASGLFQNSEALWLERFNLEIATKLYLKAALIIQQSIAKLGGQSARVWYQGIHFYRFAMGKQVLDFSLTSILADSCRAIELHPKCFKLYLQRAQIFYDSKNTKKARNIVFEALKIFPDSVVLWRYLAKCDRLLFGAPKARSLFDKAAIQIPGLPELWADRIELETAEKDPVVARQLISKALKKFPSNASIWIIHLKFIPRASHRKVAYMDALRETENSPEILLAIGVFMWTDGKYEKAKTWFDRALHVDKSNGDTWAWLYQYQVRHGSEKKRQEVIDAVKLLYSSIRSGKSWIKVKKDPINLDKTVKEMLLLVGEELLKTGI